MEKLTARTNGALSALKRSTEAKVSFATLLLQSWLDIARLSGYIDRVREVEDHEANPDVPTHPGLTAQDLLSMPEKRFGEVIDALSPDELKKAMETVHHDDD